MEGAAIGSRLTKSVGLNSDGGRLRRDLGFTVTELLIVVAIIGTLSSIVIPTLNDQVLMDKNRQAIIDLAMMDSKITVYIVEHGVPPDSLAEVGLSGKLDPWGRSYRYLNVFGDGPGPPAPRKDHFLVPLNSDFDLYSSGPDGLSQSPLTSHQSRDDIVRANNGGYIGLASAY